MNRPLREQIIAISARISVLREEVKARETELRKAEAELDALFSGAGDAPAPGFQSAAVDDGRTLNDTVLGLINSTPETRFSAEDLLAKIPDANNINSIRSALARLTGQNRIARAGRGQCRSLATATAGVGEENLK